MRIYFFAITLVLASCKSAQQTRAVSYFFPLTIQLGTDITVVRQKINLDTTKYSVTGWARHLKEYTMVRRDLDKLNFENNYADSIKFSFYNDRLFSINIFASGNRNVEYLKFAIQGEKETSLRLGDHGTNDTTFNYGKYSELAYRSSFKHIWYYYTEDIVDNTARLEITNKKMFKAMPRKSIH
jgi:hypothetical protein